MAKRNPAREIAISLIAAAVLGAGIYFYLRSTIPTAEELRSSMQPPAANASASATPANSLNDQATAITQRFLDALREQRFRDAHALTTRAYQRSTRPLEFEAAITGSPYMINPRQISFLRVSQQSLKRENGTVELGPVLARGMLVSDHGNVDVSVTLSPEEGTLHILSIIGAGVPLFNGIVSGKAD